MAKPAFIYAFDNLGPNRFAEICGELLGSRYKGFGLLLMGGVGADGGIDAELDVNLGIWEPESEQALLDGVIQPEKTVVFQFKHIVVARAGGQTKARSRLLGLYNCHPENKCELCRRLVLQKKPSIYVLVTNVEINSVFRRKFKQLCQANHPEVGDYQIIGLDELETWITMETHLRHLYFPTIFGPPQFDLKVLLSQGFADFYNDGSIYIHSSIRDQKTYSAAQPGDRFVDLFQVSVLNTGTVPSYISTIGFKFIVDKETRVFFWENVYQEAFPEIRLLNNPELGTPLEPGRRQLFRFPFEVIRKMKENVENAFPVEILVYDEIGNMYGTIIPENLREKML